MKKDVKMTAKKALAAILSSALLGSVFPMGAMAADVTKSYFDVDFDQSGDTDTVWTNKADSGYGFGYAGWASAINEKTALVEDSFTGSKALEISRTAGTDPRYYIGTAQNIGCTDTLDNCVAWYETSLKFDGNITPIQFDGSNMGLYPINIFADGSIRIGHPARSVVNNYTLVPGKWYHIVVAVDSINKLGNDSKFSAWVNGTLLTTGESSAYTISINFNRTIENVKFQFSAPATDSKLYLDNFKMYTTSGGSDVEDYDPMAIFGDASLEMSGYDIVGETIYVPTNATVADVMAKATVSGTGSAVYADGVKLEQEDWAAANAIGKSILVYSDGCLFPREYSIAAISAQNYYDVNFDRAGEMPALSVNTASDMPFGYGGWGSHPGNVNELVKDEITGSTALAYNIPAGSGTYVVGHTSSGYNCPDSFDNRVTWYEFSMKFDAALPNQVRLNATGTVFVANEDGTIILGAGSGSEVNNLKMVPGEWYHFVIAYDNINKYSGKDTRIFAWADGKYLTTAESDRTGCTISRALGYSTTKMDRFYFATASSSANDSRMNLDNIRMYTTVGADDVAAYNPALKYASIESDSWFVNGDTLYIADDEWLLSDLADFVTTDGEMIFCDGSGIIGEDMLGNTDAPGKLIYVRAADKPVRKYRIDTGVFARAWYNGNEMLGAKMSGYLTSLTEAGLDVAGATAVKTFFWRSAGSLVPICAAETK